MSAQPNVWLGILLEFLDHAVLHIPEGLVIGFNTCPLWAVSVVACMYFPKHLDEKKLL
jgi:hypothetical protein